MTEPLNQRVERDFAQRSLQDQKDFMENTWCDHCQVENLGLLEPTEYEVDSVIFIEGRCLRCDNIVTTELTDDDF